MVIKNSSATYSPATNFSCQFNILYVMSPFEVCKQISIRQEFHIFLALDVILILCVNMAGQKGATCLAMRVCKVASGSFWLPVEPVSSSKDAAGYQTRKNSCSASLHLGQTPALLLSLVLNGIYTTGSRRSWGV